MLWVQWEPVADKAAFHLDMGLRPPPPTIPRHCVLILITNREFPHTKTEGPPPRELEGIGVQSHPIPCP